MDKITYRHPGNVNEAFQFITCPFAKWTAMTSIFSLWKKENKIKQKQNKNNNKLTRFPGMQTTEGLHSWKKYFLASEDNLIQRNKSKMSRIS